MSRRNSAWAVKILCAVMIAGVAWLAGCGLAAKQANAAEPEAKPIKVLFLGDVGHHVPLERAKQLIPVLLRRGIQCVYTDSMDDLNPATLGRYDALLVYANIDKIEPNQAKALLDYVASGHGFVPLHCASYCFRNNPEVVALIGAQFKSHTTGTFRCTTIAPDHPVMKGFKGFESWDETYVHTLHNEKDRIVLEKREEEPYTWVRTHGKGRVFYTAWGHDQRTFGNPGFADLVERGIRWATGDDHPAETIAKRPETAPLEYVDQKVAYYRPPGSPIEKWNQMQKPLSAAESMKHMIVPGGFEVKLFASEPQIKKPICMAWDERGRLWVAETMDYPNELQPEGEGHDRITICEDTDGDGVADKFTVFADKLSIPTSIAFYAGGIIVQQAPDTLFLKSSKGDDHADIRKKLITGWGTGDTHAGPSNLAYGLDNWMWGMVGYSSFKGTVGSKNHEFHMGFYRFKPDGSMLEFIRSTNNNTWGFGVSEEGIIFGSTANNNPSDYMPIANRYYEAIRGFPAATLSPISDSPRFLPITEKVRQVDVHGGYTAATGHQLYTARRYPKEYWNRTAFVAEPTGHLIGTFELTPRGADFRSHNPTNLFASDDEWTAPINADVGPDGNVWFIDWYNYIVQHNPTPQGYKTGRRGAYETELRDKRYGRVYRIVYNGPDGKPLPAFTLDGATPQKLVETLKNDNLFWRRHAQRLLVERGSKDVVPALIALVNDSTVDEIGLNVGAIHALWTLQGINALDGSDPAALAAVVGAIKHPSAGVRRNAVAVLALTPVPVEKILEARLLDDADAQVRLATLLTLADMPASDVAGRAIAAMIQKPVNSSDHWIVDAATAAAARHSAGFLAGLPTAITKPAQPAIGPNILPNPSFEEAKDGQPVGWHTSTFSGKAEFKYAEGEKTAKTGTHSVRITSKDGADAGWAATVPVKPNTRYRLGAWVRTDRVNTLGGAKGVMLNVHELQGVEGAVTNTLKATNDWKRVETIFNSGGHSSLTINCLFGGWGQATGTAFFDDVALQEVGPTDNLAVETIVQLVTQHASGAIQTDVADDPDTKTIALGIVPNVLKYDTAKITVKAGQKLKIVLTNPDQMQHNFVLLAPGSLDRFGAAADKFLTDPQATAKNFTPDSPDILAKMPMVNPFSKFELRITAPQKPGEYPFVCTFPGHWRIMQGVMVVTP